MSEIIELRKRCVSTYVLRGWKVVLKPRLRDDTHGIYAYHELNELCSECPIVSE